MRHPRRPTRRRSSRLVLLAVYRLADEEGLWCLATNKAIAADVGLSADTVTGALRAWERAGVLDSFGTADGLCGRRILLMDHPDAPAVREMVCEAYDVRRPASAP